MAERRMFAKTIIDSDSFLEMPLGTQALYFHLSMRADDEGFLNNPRKICRMVNASDDDLKLLIAKKFILPFESGVVVIKHWKIHNIIQKDRFKATVYQDERQMLEVKSNGSYTMDTSCIQNVSGLDTDRIQDGHEMETQYRLGKVSIGKDRLGEDRIGEDGKPKPTRHKYGEYQNVLLTDEEYDKLRNEFPDDYEARIDRLSYYIKSTGKVYKDHLATIRNWARMDKDRKKTGSSDQPASNNPFLQIAEEEGYV